MQELHSRLHGAKAWQARQRAEAESKAREIERKARNAAQQARLEAFQNIAVLFFFESESPPMLFPLSLNANLIFRHIPVQLGPQAAIVLFLHIPAVPG